MHSVQFHDMWNHRSIAMLLLTYFRFPQVVRADDDVYPDQGELGTCALHAYATVGHEQTLFTYDIEVAPSMFQHKLKTLADVAGLNLFGGSTSAELGRLLNTNLNARYEDSARKKVVRMGFLELPQNTHAELVEIVQRTPGVASVFASTSTARGNHAVAAYRLHAKDARECTETPTVIGKNSHGASNTAWPITQKNWVASSLLIPLIWDVEVLSVSNQTMTSIGPPDFTPEFKNYRDVYYPKRFAGDFRTFDLVKRRSTKKGSSGNLGVIVGDGSRNDTVKAFFFGSAARAIETYVKDLQLFTQTTRSELATEKIGLLPGGFKKDDEVVFFLQQDFQGVSCLDRGRVKGQSVDGGLEIKTKRTIVKLPAGTRFRDIVLPMDEIRPWMDTPRAFKPGDAVYSLVSRYGWIGKNGVRRDLRPGDLGTFKCYTPQRNGGFHLFADFGDVTGSVLDGDLVEGDIDKHGEAMAEILPGGFRRSDSVLITEGSHKGKVAEVNGPHTLTGFLWVSIPNDGGKIISGGKSASVQLYNIAASSLRLNTELLSLAQRTDRVTV